MDFLDSGKKIFQSRNSVYGNSYKESGELLAAFFGGKGITLTTAEDFARFAVFLHCADKMKRYANVLSEGGHEDSAQDLCVYAAMLRELTEEVK